MFTLFAVTGGERRCTCDLEAGNGHTYGRPDLVLGPFLLSDNVTACSRVADAGGLSYYSCMGYLNKQERGAQP